MSEPKWTPGPWFATNIDYPDYGTLGGNDCEKATWTVSTTPDAPGWRHDGGYPGYGVSEANAHLIAAAPELYETLEEVMDHLSDLRGELLAGGITLPNLNKALFALAKARGETS